MGEMRRSVHILVETDAAAMFPEFHIFHYATHDFSMFALSA